GIYTRTGNRVLFKRIIFETRAVSSGRRLSAPAPVLPTERLPAGGVGMQRPVETGLYQGGHTCCRWRRQRPRHRCFFLQGSSRRLRVQLLPPGQASPPLAEGYRGIFVQRGEAGVLRLPGYFLDGELPLRPANPTDQTP